jgi:putative FmdB family regulatory protein
MPTYEYECDACGHAFEDFQSMTAKPLKICPQCKTRKLRRLIGTGAALLFKGSGFYATDYRSSEYQKQAKAETASATSNSSDSSKSAAESKPKNSGDKSTSADKKKSD